MLTLALITDIHFGEDRGFVRGSQFENMFRHFSAGVERETPDLIVELGDRINDLDAEIDRERIETVAGLFSQLRPASFHLMGNHDIGHISADENAEILGCPKGSHVLDKNGYRMVFWNPDPSLEGPADIPPNPAGDALDWLKMELDGADKPVILFSHYPLDGTPLTGNPYFEDKYKAIAYYPDTGRIRQAIEASGRVVACFNGHTHWFSHKFIDGIHYVTVPSFSETAFTYGEISHNYAIAKFEDTMLSLDIYGLNHFSMPLPLRKKGQHWEYPYREELGIAANAG